MSGIKLTWDIGVFNPEKHFIYRSASPISPSNLPTPIAEVGQGINQYNDLSITDGETYHYFVAAEKMGLLCPADSSVGALALMYGPGPQTLIAGDMTEGFFGEVTQDELFSNNDITQYLAITIGNQVNIDSPWLKFAIDQKILYVAKKPYRTVAWSNIYEVGAVYGVDGVGSNPIGEPTNQYTTLNKNGSVFLVRLLTGGDANTTTESTLQSEWNRLMYKVHIDDPTNSNWYNYTTDDLGLQYATLVQETSFYDSTERTIRGRDRDDFIEYINDVPASARYNWSGWRPVLELIQ